MITIKCFLTLLAGVAVAAAQPFAYVSNQMGNNVVVVNQATNTVAATIPISGAGLGGVALMPSGGFVYVTEQNKASVAIISTATNTVVGTVPVGTTPRSSSFHPQ